ncbi:U2-type spliceosomal complex subunit CWC15 LALA0_S03e02168g [Lachancea lanzarotensis]|uniref:Pre-mRNA-splicing factor CWC15 n=1 Tax=Lachancea lanzarotensis TaxID=1245769 RepID=A0A0C7MNF1_9SACH|nr:uncharacterized protein LALA0_S03e02168g [Lachancea lanzarotensis]CEP61407.1 LALA0S03e02168g1_1 [Lachancea lanzarotensis]
MTTSHRPQLEARNGAKGSYVPTSIQHARLLPGHTKLKYRKRKLDDDEEVLRSKRHGVKAGKEFKGDEREFETDQNKEASQNREIDVSQRGQEEEKDQEDEEEEDEGEEDEGEEEEEEEEEDDEEEEEEDQEALLEELHKIRQERMIKKLKEDRERQDEENENPSIKENKASRKSWRSQTVFGRQKSEKPINQSSDDPKAKYTNDMTRSSFHHDFMRKYVR